MLTYHFFKERPNICAASAVLIYLNRTKNIRGETQNLILSWKKPHKAISSETIGRWLKKVLKKSKIDEQFTGHSTRHASSFKAFYKGFDVNSIKHVVGWSERSKVFSKFYNRTIKNSHENYANTICNSL